MRPPKISHVYTCEVLRFCNILACHPTHIHVHAGFYKPGEVTEARFYKPGEVTEARFYKPGEVTEARFYKPGEVTEARFYKPGEVTEARFYFLTLAFFLKGSPSDLGTKILQN